MTDIKEIDKELILGDNRFSITTLSDGYINATQLASSCKKKFNDWYRLDGTKELIKYLEVDTGIPPEQLIIVKKGNTDKFKQGSFIHQDLAIHFAQWCSPAVALQVSKWIKELLLTGKVELKNSDMLKLQKQLDDQMRIAKEAEQKLIEESLAKENAEQKLIEESLAKESAEQKLIESDKARQKAEAIAKEAIEKKKLIIDQMKSRISSAVIATKKEYLYIATTTHDMEKNIYKIGKTENLKHRLSTYNTGKPVDSKYFYVYYHLCYNGVGLENVIRCALPTFIMPNTKDVFQIRFDYLKNICLAAINGHENVYELSNELVNVIMTDEYYSAKTNIAPLQLPDDTEVEQPAKIVLENLNQQDLENLIKSCINIYIRNNYDTMKTFSYDLFIANKYKIPLSKITIKWNEIKKMIDEQAVYKSIMPAKNKFRQLLCNAKPIGIIWKG